MPTPAHNASDLDSSGTSRFNAAAPKPTDARSQSAGVIDAAMSVWSSDTIAPTGDPEPGIVSAHALATNTKAHSAISRPSVRNTVVD